MCRDKGMVTTGDFKTNIVVELVRWQHRGNCYRLVTYT